MTTEARLSFARSYATRPTGHSGYTYRPDIDGLRAIAVLAVVAYHLSPSGLRGGFAGVDVFFVISGYLITGIILRDLSTGGFRFKEFYARRIRRIFPALILVLAGTFVAGWSVLYPSEFAALSRQVVAGTLFLSNVQLWRDVGYFDEAAIRKPLLHLWSLGVEEQFYLLWPVTLYLGARVRRLGTVILTLGLISFVANIGLVAKWPVPTFYLPVTRLWELALGGYLAHEEQSAGSSLVGHRPALRDLLSIVGLVLTVGSFLLVRTDSAFPGWWATIPTLGTLFLLAAGPGAAVNRRVLSLRALVGVGLISYALYLWHWPLLTYSRLVAGENYTLWYGVAAVAVAFVLACLSFTFVERPIRTGFRGHRWGLVPPICAAMGIVLAFGISAAIGHTRARLSSPGVIAIDNARNEWEYPPAGFDGERNRFRVNTIAGRLPGTTLFVGDSHAEQYWSRVQQVFAAESHELRSVEFLTEGGCPPVHGVDREVATFRCPQFVDQLMKRALRPDVQVVVFSAWWENYFVRGFVHYMVDPEKRPVNGLAQRDSLALEAFGDQIDSLVRARKRVYVVLSNPASEAFDPRSMLPKRIGSGHAPPPGVVRVPLTAGAIGFDNRLRETVGRAGAYVIDPTPFLCDAGVCRTTMADGSPRYKDSNHLRPSFVRTNAVYIDAALR